MRPQLQCKRTQTCTRVQLVAGETAQTAQVSAQLCEQDFDATRCSVISDDTMNRVAGILGALAAVTGTAALRGTTPPRRPRRRRAHARCAARRETPPIPLCCKKKTT